MVTGTPTNYYKTVSGRVSWRILVHDEKPPVIQSLPMAATMCTAFEYPCEPQGGFVSHSHTPERSGLPSAARGAGAVRFSLPPAVHAGEPRESADLAAARIGLAGLRRKTILPYNASMIELAGASFLVLLDGAQTLPRPLAWWDEHAGRRGWRYLRYPRTAP